MRIGINQAIALGSLDRGVEANVGRGCRGVREAEQERRERDEYVSDVLLRFRVQSEHRQLERGERDEYRSDVLGGFIVQPGHRQLGRLERRVLAGYGYEFWR